MSTDPQLLFSGSLGAQFMLCNFLEICEERMKSVGAVFMGTPFRLFNTVNVHDLPLYHYKHICIYFCKIH